VSTANSLEHRTTIGALRRILLGILVFGVIGTAAELLLLSHDEGALQLVPLVLIAVGMLVICWHLLSVSPTSLRALRVSMLAFILAGGIGVGLHYRGSAEFQTEVDPTLGGFALFKKVMTSKAPPALAPGVMAQLGLLGLAYTYRHPANSRDK
jgi:hypothetical protein